MKMMRKRIFVGNLPPSTTQDEIKQKFCEFGNVLSVEIKSRLDKTTFAFLDVEIDLYQLDICFKTLTNKKWNGKEIKLELAKESFLSRLQREREQNDTSKPASNSNVDTFHKVSVPESLNIIKKNAASKYVAVINETFRNDHIDDESCNASVKKLDQDVEYKGKLRMFSGSKSVVSEDDHKPEVRLAKIKTKSYEKRDQTLEWNSSNKSNFEKHILPKFESYSDVWKDSSDDRSEVRVEHPDKIYTKSNSKLTSSAKDKRYTGVKKKKSQSEDRNYSEETRIKALIEKNVAFTREKRAIAQALADVDSKKKLSKKIIFNSDDEEDGYEQNKEIPQNKQNKSEDCFEAAKPQLFSDDEHEEEDGTDFKVKEQFEGKKGHKLLKMQSRYGNDRRFFLDERFQESDEDKDEEPEEIEVPIEDERLKQMEILESVVGHSIYSRSKSEENSKPKRMSMLRFDPTKPDHAKYEIKQETNLTEKKKQNKKRKMDSHLEEEAAVGITKKVKHRIAEPVSKDKFYQISDSLKDSFKMKEKAQFSLLSLFGAVEKDQGCGIEDKMEDNSGALSQFELDEKLRNFESFSGLPADLEVKDNANVLTPDPSKKGRTSDPLLKAQKATKQGATLGVWRESFFFTGKDERLKEGLDFLKRSDDSEDMEKFRERRQELKRTVRVKVQHNSQPRNMWHNKLETKRIFRRNNRHK